MSYTNFSVLKTHVHIISLTYDILLHKCSVMPLVYKQVISLPCVYEPIMFFFMIPLVYEIQEIITQSAAVHESVMLWDYCIRGCYDMLKKMRTL